MTAFWWSRQHPQHFLFTAGGTASQKSLMTSGCTECWGIQSLGSGSGFSVLNTHLLWSPVMETVNLGHWPSACLRMLLFSTEVSKLFCKETVFLVSNTDFHCASEKNPRLSLLKKYHSPIHPRKYFIKWLRDLVAGQWFVNPFLVYSLWLLDIKMT